MGDYYDRGGVYRSSTTTNYRSYSGKRGGGMDIVVYNPSCLSSRYRSPDRPPVQPRRSASHGGGSFWGFDDPEMKRRTRVARYKAYSVEGRVKASIRNGFRWLKVKCSELVHGW